VEVEMGAMALRDAWASRDDYPAGAPAARGAKSGRGERHLYLVRPEDVVARPAPRLVLTRAGRLARTLLAVGVLSLGILMLSARLAAPGPIVVDHEIVVRPGQTLSHVATEQLPSLPVDRGVGLLREVNGLSSSQLSAGQVLEVPAR